MDFQNFETLIIQIEIDLGHDFNQKFREARRKLAKLTNLPNRTLFSEYDKDRSEWVYNRGGKKEIQYHLYLRNGELGYGLGINAQRGSFNNDDPAKIANSIGSSFKELYSDIKNILPNYSFKIGFESQLGNMKEEEFLLFGNSIPSLNNKLNDDDYQLLISDLKKQFEVYRMVFELNNTKNEKLSIQEIQLKEMDRKVNLLKYKKQIILQGPPGTGKTKLAKEVAIEIIKANAIDSTTVPVKALTKEFIKANLSLNQKIEGKNDTKFEVVAVEDKVVVVKSDVSKPWRPSYNKIIDSFNGKLWGVKSRNGGFKPYEDAIAKYLYDNYFDVIDEVEESVVKQSDFVSLIQFHPSYTYEDFVRGIVANPNAEGEGIFYKAENKILAEFAQHALDDSDNNYVLIIDEINRANISSVLGELIYALEYRGEAVESMYSVDQDNKLILPPNLFIIGTMNTADRSVGHIDYAIRRRFAFVDVLPQDLTNDSTIKFDGDLFRAVKELFTTDDYKTHSNYLSREFEPKDVALGHSYFIQHYEKDANGNEDKTKPIDFKFRLEYEIKPILREYVRDGILIGENIKQIIEELNSSI